MENTQEKEKCDLCGMEIKGQKIIEDCDGEEKHFCCEGCAQVYKSAYENGMIDEVLSLPEEKQNPDLSFIFDRGESAHFSIEGMWCAGCASAAEQILRKQEGVKQVEISFAAEKGRIQYDPDKVDPQDILNKISKLGYDAKILADQREKQKSKQQEKTFLQFLVALGFGMQIMILYLVQLYPQYAQGNFNIQDVRNIQYVVWFLATPVLLYGGSSFMQGAWRALKSGTATMDTLVALGTISAYTYSAYIAIMGNGEVYFDSVAMITTFIMFGRYIEAIGGSEARKDIRKLLNLRPRKAWKRVDDQWQEVNSVELKKGDTVLIKEGEKVPADSRITDGTTSVNESMLSGESRPVTHEEGEMVYAGTIINDGAIEAKVEVPLRDSRFSQITTLVEETLATKPPIQRMADKVAAYFAFGIIAVALITLGVRLMLGQAFSQAILTSVAVLVVACPCALGLATPLAIVVTMGKTTRAGLFIRKPNALETGATIQRMVFDKTGTLTQGELSVIDIVVDEKADIDKEDLVCKAAAVEQFSNHPIAKAIIKRCQQKIEEARGSKNLKGLGTSAGVAHKRILVGSDKFLDVDKNSSLYGKAEKFIEEGKTVVWIGWEGDTTGFFVFSDEPNSSAKDALNQLNKLDIETVLLSGDHPKTTEAIATSLEIKDYEGNCPPDQKARRIKDWQKEGKKIAMVGDGINDAPALAQSDLSFTVAGGTDIAGETSDVIMTKNDLTLIPWFLKQSQKTRRIIMENLGWAFAYNLVAVPLAAFGVISPVIAAGAMATSSLLVVGNSLRLRKD